MVLERNKTEMEIIDEIENPEVNIHMLIYIKGAKIAQ